MLHCNIHPENPQIRFLKQAADIMKNSGGICVYPTDTVYGMGACASNPKSVAKIGDLLKKDKSRLFSYIFSDFSEMSRYVKIDNVHFRFMKQLLPGPFTFILNATNYVPKKICPKRRTIGVRIPDCTVCKELVTILGEPLANTSLNLPGKERGNPDNILKTNIRHDIDMFIDTGPLPDPTGSTIIDYTKSSPVIIRQGKGKL